MYRLTIDMQPDLRDGRTSRISANSPNKKNLGMPASKAKSVQRGSEPKVQISVAKSERKKVSCQDEESCMKNLAQRGRVAATTVLDILIMDGDTVCVSSLEGIARCMYSRGNKRRIASRMQGRRSWPGPLTSRP